MTTSHRAASAGAMAAARRLYRLQPIDRTGVLLGLSLLQLGVAGFGVVFGSIVMVTESVPVGIVVAFLFATIGLVKLSGEPLLHQIPHVVRFARQGRSARTWHRPLPILGPSSRTTRAMPELARQEIIEVQPAELGVEGRGLVAVVVDRRAGLYSVTVRIAGRQFGLLEPHEQDWQLSQWGNVLQQFVQERPPVVSIRWSEWAAPSGIEEQLEWLAAHEASQPIPDAVASYERLLAESGPIATRHEVLLTITVHSSRVRLQRRHLGDRQRASMESLLTEARLLVSRLQSARLSAWLLTPAEMTRAVRLRLDPAVRSLLDRREAELGVVEGAVSIENASPLAARETWTGWVTDGSMHRAFFVSEWPRLEVQSDWMRPLLLWSACVRTVSVLFEPVPRSKSQRTITAQATKIEADVAHRNETGFRVGAWHRRAAQAVAEREEELVAGYGELTYAGVVTITARTRDQLDQATADLTQVAASVGIELRPLHGRHSAGVLATLPLARSLAPQT